MFESYQFGWLCAMPCELTCLYSTYNKTKHPRSSGSHGMRYYMSLSTLQPELKVDTKGKPNKSIRKYGNCKCAISRQNI